MFGFMLVRETYFILRDFWTKINFDIQQICDMVTITIIF